VWQARVIHARYSNVGERGLRVGDGCGLWKYGQMTIVFAYMQANVWVQGMSIYGYACITVHLGGRWHQVEDIQRGQAFNNEVAAYNTK
jgi:hypothetical protein